MCLIDFLLNTIEHTMHDPRNDPIGVKFDPVEVKHVINKVDVSFRPRCQPTTLFVTHRGGCCRLCRSRRPSQRFLGFPQWISILGILQGTKCN